MRPRLLRLRAQAEARLAGVTASRSDVVDAARGANVDDEHDPEGATIAFERAQLETLAGDARAALCDDRIGSLEAGKQADLLLLDLPDVRHLPYWLGLNPVQAVIKRGRLIESQT